MVSDPISDFLTRIKNGYLARKKEIAAPYSKTKEEIGRILEKEGYVKKIQISNSKFQTPMNQKHSFGSGCPVPSLSSGTGANSKSKTPKFKTIQVELLYKDKQTAIENVKRISKPAVRVYVDKDNLPRVLSGYGIAIISTSKGLMTDKEARKRGLGGEVICEVW